MVAAWGSRTPSGRAPLGKGGHGYEAIAHHSPANLLRSGGATGRVRERPNRRFRRCIVFEATAGRRDLNVAVGGLLTAGGARAQRIPALGPECERPRRNPRPPGRAEDRRRRVQSHPGCDQLPELHLGGPCRLGLRTILEPPDHPHGANRQTVRLRLRRAFRRVAHDLQRTPQQRVLHPTRTDPELRGPVRQLHPLAPGQGSSEDRCLPHRRRPLHVSDRH